MFDADMDLLVNPNEEDIKFLDNVNQYFEGMGRLAYELPLYKIYKNNLYHFYMDAIQVCVNINNYVVSVMHIHYFQGTYDHSSKYANRLQEKLERGESSDVQGMLEQWLSEKKMSTKEAVVLSSGMLIAGVHTVYPCIYRYCILVVSHVCIQTAYQSTYLLFELAKNPEVQERLYQEIQSVVRERPPTAQDLEAMPYLRGCIKECFRYIRVLV